MPLGTIPSVLARGNDNKRISQAKNSESKRMEETLLEINSTGSLETSCKGQPPEVEQERDLTADSEP